MYLVELRYKKYKLSGCCKATVNVTAHNRLCAVSGMETRPISQGDQGKIRAHLQEWYTHGGTSHRQSAEQKVKQGPSMMTLYPAFSWN